MTTPSIETIPVGLCQCGCGQKTAISNKTSKRRGCVKGEPVRFLTGHRPQCSRTDFSDAVPFKIDGVYCKLIQLTRGMYTIVDETDYGWLSERKWLSIPANVDHGYGNYAARIEPDEKITWMHREILGLKRGDGLDGDHIDTRHTLDNRRKNLRVATNQQNRCNTRKTRLNKSGFKGVHARGPNSFAAQIGVNGEKLWLGTRPTAQRAWEELYVPASRKYHQEFGRSS